jgi:hypothetical protein
VAFDDGSVAYEKMAIIDWGDRRGYIVILYHGLNDYIAGPNTFDMSTHRTGKGKRGGGKVN